MEFSFLFTFLPDFVQISTRLPMEYFKTPQIVHILKFVNQYFTSTLEIKSVTAILLKFAYEHLWRVVQRKKLM